MGDLHGTAGVFVGVFDLLAEAERLFRLLRRICRPSPATRLASSARTCWGMAIGHCRVKRRAGANRKQSPAPKLPPAKTTLRSAPRR